MARGWESKSVEAQIDEAEVHLRSAVLKKSPNPEMLEIIRKKENILLSRTRVLRELESAQNPRYKAVLTKALADLEAQLSSIDASSAGDAGLNRATRAAHS
jgi:hypothetical protein